MRALVQRVKESSVLIGGKLQSSINKGILILVGIRYSDEERDAVYTAEKCVSLRIFDDPEGKMNLSVRDVGGEAMIVSQFTLYGETRKGNRPSYAEAADPQKAEALYERFLAEMRNLLGEKKVRAGIFRAMMDIHLVNDGPVTLIVESKEKTPIRIGNQ